VLDRLAFLLAAQRRIVDLVARELQIRDAACLMEAEQVASEAWERGE